MMTIQEVFGSFGIDLRMFGLIWILRYAKVLLRAFQGVCKPLSKRREV
jgi:hypothetical protein